MHKKGDEKGLKSKIEDKIFFFFNRNALPPLVPLEDVHGEGADDHDGDADRDLGHVVEQVLDELVADPPLRLSAHLLA